MITLLKIIFSIIVWVAVNVLISYIVCRIILWKRHVGGNWNFFYGVMKRQSKRLPFFIMVNYAKLKCFATGIKLDSYKPVGRSRRSAGTKVLCGDTFAKRGNSLVKDISNTGKRVRNYRFAWTDSASPWTLILTSDLYKV